MNRLIHILFKYLAFRQMVSPLVKQKFREKWKDIMPIIAQDNIFRYKRYRIEMKALYPDFRA